MSQSELEIDTELSFGTISRIESGKINPTKETLMKVAKVLALREPDTSYLLRLQASDPSKEEIADAVKQVKYILDKEEFPAYLMDTKIRGWAFNKMLLEIFEVPEKDISEYIGENIDKILFLSKLNILKKIPAKYLIPVITEQIRLTKSLSKRYSLEPYTQTVLNDLKKNSLFNKLWDKIKPAEGIPFRANFYLKYKKATLRIVITTIFLPSDPRFMLIEYFPRDKSTAEVFEKIREKVK